MVYSFVQLLLCSDYPEPPSGQGHWGSLGEGGTVVETGKEHGTYHVIWGLRFRSGGLWKELSNVYAGVTLHVKSISVKRYS